LLKNYFWGVILSEAKNLILEFEKKNEILRRYAPQNDNQTGFFNNPLSTGQ